jgi:hypothetical protein
MSKLLISLERVDVLIRRRATGDPAAFAHKLGIHRSTLFCWIRQLREQYGCPIEYDPYRKTYYYTEKGRLLIGFQRRSAPPPPPTRGVVEK